MTLPAGVGWSDLIAGLASLLSGLSYHKMGKLKNGQSEELRRATINLRLHGERLTELEADYTDLRQRVQGLEAAEGRRSRGT